MSWVTLDASGAVTGFAANAAPVPSTGWTEVADDDPRIAAFLIRAPTTISAAGFLARFTSAEQAAIQAAAATNASIALGLTMGLAAGVVYVSSPTVQAWMQGLVAAGVLTAARSAQVLDLAQASP